MHWFVFLVVVMCLFVFEEDTDFIRLKWFLDFPSFTLNF